MTTSLSPSQIFERRWAQMLLDAATDRLRDEYRKSGKEELFETLHVFLADDSRFGDYVQVAAKLGMTSGTVSVNVHRLRQRYRALLRDIVLTTVGAPEQVDAEMKHLVEALRG